MSGESGGYVIYRAGEGAGFMSNFTCVLQGIDNADLAGLEPVVDMERHPNHYTEEVPVRGTRNSWEYYFEQPGGMSLEEALKEGASDNGGDVTGRFTTIFALVPPAETIARGRELVSRYVRVHQEILDRVDQILPAGTGQRILGVHVRGTDTRKGIYPGHPVSDVLGAYLERVERLDAQNHYDRIFLATDEQAAAERFQERFGARLIRQDSQLSDLIPEHSSQFSKLFEGERPLNRYLMGLEVLIDTLALSRCTDLAGGMSNVTHVAMYFGVEDQEFHPIPPLWVLPETGGPSHALKFIDQETLFSAETRAAQLRFFVDFLRRTEDRLCGEQKEGARSREALEEARAEIEAHRKESARNSARLTAAEERIQQLKEELEFRRRNFLSRWWIRRRRNATQSDG